MNDRSGSFEGRTRSITLEELQVSHIAKAHGIPNECPPELLGNLEITRAGMERVRAFLGQPIIVTSGYRCPELNVIVRGALRSQHLAGQAADFLSPGFGDPHAVCQALRNARFILGIDQLILEAAWTHASFTLEPRYQVLRCYQPGEGYVDWA